MRDQAGIAIAGGPNGAFDSEFDYVMKINVDYVTNLLYKIPILAQEGTSPETTCRRSKEWRPATAARNRTAGGPDPDENRHGGANLRALWTPIDFHGYW